MTSNFKPAQEFKDLIAQKDVSKEKVLDWYAGKASQYDANLASMEAKGPARTAQNLANLVPEKERSELRILDVGAGTGRIGEELQKLGFRIIDAIDPSKELMDVLRSKKIYDNVWVEYFGGEASNFIQDSSYDAVVISGGFSQCHLPVSCLDDILRILKSGGYFVNSMSYTSIDLPEMSELEPKMKSFCEAGKWTQLERSVEDGHRINAKGLYHVFKKV